ncbi:MAG TPA: DUF692 domain-containing protein [Polyangiaceae bacterium]|jgi:hypothetical protein|nr:DUF692 domain-containing protein [Polyangiaceae bacterium]
MTAFPSGVGIGLRAGLAAELMAAPPAELAFVEVTPENYLRRGGRYAEMLKAAMRRFPVVTHGLSLSLGGPDRLDAEELRALDRFLGDVGTPWHSDHLSFGAVDGAMLHDLLPVPFSRAAVRHVADRIGKVQDALRVPFAVENITYYEPGTGSEMDEGDFVTEVVRTTGAGLLLDVNNVYVNGKNHGLDPRAVLARMPLDRVVQIHIAGHDASDPALLIDTHAEPVLPDVHALLEWVLERTGPVPVLLERDDNFPPWEELCAEVRRIDGILRAAPAQKKAGAC